MMPWGGTTMTSCDTRKVDFVLGKARRGRTGVNGLVVAYHRVRGEPALGRKTTSHLCRQETALVLVINIQTETENDPFVLTSDSSSAHTKSAISFVPFASRSQVVSLEACEIAFP